ncbi:hypothetical protein NQ317_005914 [Molorchus minor]|uniref:Leucyl-tRNA synthetase n=1 Tax=Molorchus minor TaxID=1323400 RepID=A0ABQ9JG81_9CUCU|nr:hypothetical protein NQ317_005914 [Molorchus minor]
MSRSGDECVVALCDQWFLNYGEPNWKAQAQSALEGINTYHDEVRKNFVSCLKWLHEYACSRTYGLGTKLPWDEKWLIESLSDSTIYMAYYTIAHFLQGNSFRANGHLLLNSAKMSKSEGNFLTLSEAIDKFSADGMRLCLADAGDSIEDANFVETMADAGILRLYTLIEWVKEIMANKSTLRSGALNGFNDLVFQSEINLKIRQTDENYKKMLFKEALKTGFFEMQTIRDKYRELSLDGMHKDLITQFIEVQALLISPICPHVAEHVWQLLGNTTSILKAKWPISSSIDEILIKKSEYLMETAHSFRVHLKTYLQGIKTKTNPNPPPVPKPNVINIWVAKTYPQWQSIVLTTLKRNFDKNGALPDNKTLSTEFAKIAELKKYMKRVMPFVQATRERVEETGVEDVIIKYTDDKDATEKMKECCPGAPFVLFSKKSGVNIEFVNPISQNGLFSKRITISDGDDYAKVVQRLVKDEKIIKKPESVELWRYEDPILGDCKLPHFNEPTKDKIKIPVSSTFKIDVDKKKVFIVSNGITVEIGTQVTYLVV